MLINQKTSKALRLVVFLLSLTTGRVVSAGMNGVNIHLAVINDQKFQVSFAVEEAVRRLDFRSTPNHSRTQFWSAISNEFELVHSAEGDVIQRLDRESFKTVSFIVDIVDFSWPNYYRPFSPLFSPRSGVVVHTGQFFVCYTQCGDAQRSWKIVVTAANKNIVHYGGSSISMAAWQDRGDGRSFYVGPKYTAESENLIAIIDPGLPAKLTTILTTELPSLINRLAKQFAVRQTKPLVFASYNNGDPALSGFQGGVLKNTVAMHWWGPNLEERINENGEVWFMTHEIAHFYQSQESDIDVDEVAWIHEGFAELMAATILAEGSQALKDYVHHRFTLAKSGCTRGIQSTPLGTATQLRQFDLHYQCGLLLHHFITQNARVKITVFELWNRYRAAINSGETPSQRTYLSIVKPILSKEDFWVLQTIVDSELAPQKVVQQFLNGLTF